MEHDARPLPGALRAQLERAYDADLGAVTVHEDDVADQLGVPAVAHGTELHFARGIFQPDTPDGRHVIAHEAAHVVQQGAVASAATAPQLHGDISLEREADLAARDALAGRPAKLSRGVGAAIQGFDNWEHKLLGDATMGLEALPALPGALPLTYGDYVSLSGDYFATRSDAPAEDNLLELVRTPSPQPGKTPGTQDEVIAALDDEQTTTFRDARFLPGGIWGGLEISDEVRKRVKDRSNRLALTNREHFAQPEVGRSDYKVGESAGGSYRDMHEHALWLAYLAGRAKPMERGIGLNTAIVYDACAGHFLTDAFSAGHLRTPRADLQTHWNGVYPRFQASLVNNLAIRVTGALREHGMDVLSLGHISRDLFALHGAVFDVAWFCSGPLLPVVRSTIAGSLPAGTFGFGDLVSLLLHDADNDAGLWVENDMGSRWFATGDRHLLVDPKTGEASSETTHIQMIANAMRYGRQEVDLAYDLGLEQPHLDDRALCAAVRARLAAPALPNTEKYGAEQFMPRPRPGENGTQEWRADSLEALLPKLVRTDGGETFLTAFMLACQPGGALHDELAAATPSGPRGWGGRVAEFYSGDAKGYLVDLLEHFLQFDAEGAFENGVLHPMQTDPLQFMFSITKDAR